MHEWLVNPQSIWFAFGLALLLSELMMPGVLLIFFGMGAWTTVLLLAVFPMGIPLQFAVFFLSSVMYLVLFRAKITALLYGKACTLTNYPSSIHDDIMGREVDVSEAIVPPHPGYVVLNGTLWQAQAADAIAAGDRVRIIRQDVLLLTVEKIV